MGRHKSIITDIEKLSNRANETVLQDEEKVEKTIKQIKDILYSKEDLVALSAPQIGVDSRLFCIKFANGDIRTFINPLVIKTKGESVKIETSASFPDREFLVERYEEIHAQYQTPVGKIETNAFSGLPANIFQQMCEMLDGVLLTDVGLEIDEDFHSATEEEKEEIIKMYVTSMNERKKMLEEEIKENPNMNQLNRMINASIYFEPKYSLNREQRRYLEKNKNKLSKVGNR